MFTYDDKKKAKFFVGLFERIDESLKTGKMAEEFVDPHDAHDLEQADDLAGLAHGAEVLQGQEQEGQVEREKGEEVNHVHWLNEKLSLDRATSQPREEAVREEKRIPT